MPSKSKIPENIKKTLKEKKWVIGEREGQGGQGWVFNVFHHEIGEGMLKFTKSDKKTAQEKFRIEVETLIDPKYFHQNQIRVLDFSLLENCMWCITEKGESFFAYWNKQRDNLPAKELALLAIDFLKQLSSSLVKRHQDKKYHRDIKYENIVMVEGKPKIIDYGLLFSEEKERVTPIDENKRNRFGPPTMPGRQENPDGWLDIFNLSQLLIWMMAERGFEPSYAIDWRWVTFKEDLPEDLELKLTSILANCSEYNLSPRSAAEFLILLNQKFPEKEQDLEVRKIDVSHINEGVLVGRSQNEVTRARVQKLILAASQDASFLFQRLKEIYVDLMKELPLEGEVKVFPSGENYIFDNYVNGLYENPQNVTKVLNLFDVKETEIAAKFLQLRIEIRTFFPSSSEPPFLPEGANPITFGIERFVEIGNSSLNLTETYYIIITPDGKWLKTRHRWDGFTETSLKEISEIVRNWLEDNIVYEYLIKQSI